jgi:tripartite-type tricarboxylate transporter receptor subunit TctC
VVIGFPAGGPLDQHARLLADKLQAVLGQPILIDYKSGAGGTVGAQEVMKAAPDGYTLMLANTGVMVINPACTASCPTRPRATSRPIARTAMQPLALLVNPALPVRTCASSSTTAAAGPGQVNYGSAGNGGISHLVPEMFKSATGLFMVHIPYRGSAPAFTDLMGGQVQFMAESIPQAAGVPQAGQGAGAGRHQPRAQPGAAGHPHRHRSRHQGLRGGRLLRLPGAGRPAARRDRG